MSEYSYIVEAFRKHLDKQRHIASGVAANSLKVTKEGNDIVVRGAYYLYWVQFGRRPGGVPPLYAIRRWCSFIGLPATAAYPIALNIARKGTPGQPYVRWTEGNSLKRLDFVNDALAEVMPKLKEDIGKDFKVEIFEKFKRIQND